MKRDNSLQVYYNERLGGTLAMTAGCKIAFQYSKSCIEKGFLISPFSFPFRRKRNSCSRHSSRNE